MIQKIDEAAIEVLVRRFYAKVRQDPQIGPVFNAAVGDWEEHLAILQAFWSSVMLGSRRYKGDPLGVHMRQPIEPAMFHRWLALWRETAAEVLAPEHAAAFAAKATRIAESLKIGLFFWPERPG